MGVIRREGDDGPESLLVYHPSYGYFFPSARRKTGAPAEDMAVQAVRWDIAYPGDLTATWCAEVPHIHHSARFGVRKREYRFQVCRVDVGGVDLNAAGNPLEASIRELAGAIAKTRTPLGPRGYWGWFTEKKLRDGTGLSASLPVLVSAVLA